MDEATPEELASRRIDLIVPLDISITQNNLS
jgi:hypothetical protein